MHSSHQRPALKLQMCKCWLTWWTTLYVCVCVILGWAVVSCSNPVDNTTGPLTGHRPDSTLFVWRSKEETIFQLLCLKDCSLECKWMYVCRCECLYRIQISPKWWISSWDLEHWRKCSIKALPTNCQLVGHAWYKNVTCIWLIEASVYSEEQSL